MNDIDYILIAVFGFLVHAQFLIDFAQLQIEINMVKLFLRHSEHQRSLTISAHFI